MGLTYRTDEEVEAWKARDAIESFEGVLLKQGASTKKKIENVYARVNEEIHEGIAFAESSPFPTAEDLLEDVYFVGATS